MANASFMQTDFRGGEYSPFFQGRAEHPKYRTALNVCRNALPMEEGSWVRRPGSRLLGMTHVENGPGRVMSIEFTANEPYTLEFSGTAISAYIRFSQGDDFVYTIDGPKTITAISTANPAVMTLATAVDWVNGDDVVFDFSYASTTGALHIRGAQWSIQRVDSTHFQIVGMDGSLLGTIPSGILVRRILRVDTSDVWLNGSWVLNRIVQNEDVAIILNKYWPPQMLTVIPGTIAGTASAALEKVIFDDGPYLDPVSDASGTTSQLNWTGGTYIGPGPYTAPVTPGTIVSWEKDGLPTVTTLIPNTGNETNGFTVFEQYCGKYSTNYGGGPSPNPSPSGPDTSFAILWAEVDPTAVNAHWIGTITVVAKFRDYDVTEQYTKGDRVSTGGASYEAIASSLGVTPGLTTGWELYWAVIDNGCAVTGSPTRKVAYQAPWNAATTYGIDARVNVREVTYSCIVSSSVGVEPGITGGWATDWIVIDDGTSLTPTGFQPSDVGRLIRMFSSPPVWKSDVVYPNGVAVLYKDQVYVSTGANPGNNFNEALAPDSNFTAPEWGTQIITQVNLSQTGVWDTNATTATLKPGWAPAARGTGWTWGIIRTWNSTTSVDVEISTDSAPLLGVNNPVIALWRLGAYAPPAQYPASGGFHEGRFWLGGAIKNRFDTSQSQGWIKDAKRMLMAPTVLTGTRDEGFSSDGTVTDACGISYIFESKDANDIRWFEPDHSGLIAGTLGGEWQIKASQLSDPISPTSIQAQRVTRYGCADIEPLRTGLSLVFIQKLRRRVMEFLSDVFTGKFVAPHLNEPAKHLTSNGVAEIRYQEELAPIVWARTGDMPTTTLENP